MMTETMSRQNAMNRLTRVGVLALAAVVAVACEDITNPVEEFGRLEGPFVQFVTSQAVGTPGSEVLAIFQLPTRVDEDVEITFAFSGDAVFGQDFLVVDREGNVRSDVTASGGTARIPFLPEQTAFGRDTLRLMVPFNAVDGRSLRVEMTDARTVSGRRIETGFVETFRTFTLDIEGFVDIPTGAYVGERTGQFGTAAAAVTITKPPSPITVDGQEFDFVLSDYSVGVFGPMVPWSFSVTSGGSVLAAPRSHQFAVTSNVTGTYDFASERLTLNVTLTCCGAAGATWQLVVARP